MILETFSLADRSYSPEIIHVCVDNTHSSSLHTRALHIFSGQCSCADCNRSSTIHQENSVILNFCEGTSVYESFTITYRLLTDATAQQSPRLTCGSPIDRTTTPGSMRSLGKQYLLLKVNQTVLHQTYVQLLISEKEAYLPLQSTSEVQETMSWTLAGEQGSAREHTLKNITVTIGLSM